MPNILLPSLSQARRESFAARGIYLVESITAPEFEQVIADYLNRHNVLHLATCRNNEVRSTTLEYFNNGLTVYIVSEGGGKLANLKANPQVSYTIADPYSPEKDFFGASGLQVWGRGTVFRKNDAPEMFASINRYARTADSLEQQDLKAKAAAVNFYVITIAPDKIIYLNYRQGYRKVKWER
ncbi:MAG: pyridoxamine 5'-phosphate oxidase family protein [Deltaproteobacteria bacterium]|nr:pyridoxamine 5'-phosphate oxidase family protein [Deltaproteobacteria bacterium]